MPGFMTAPPKPVFSVLYHAFGHIDGVKTSVWLLEDRTFRVYTNDPSGHGTINKDYKVKTALLNTDTAVFELEDGTTITFTRSDDCCGWGAIQAAPPEPGVTRHIINFVPATDWAVRT